MGKNLVDGEILCLGMISEYLYMLFYAGEIQNSNCRTGNGNVFFPNKRVRFARADKAVALQYHNQRSTDTNICGGFTLGVIVGR